MATDPRFTNLPFAVTLTDAIYWMAQPDAVRALMGADPGSPATSTLAYQLAQQGYIIDVPIMVYQWDPVLTMVLRKTAGYTWVPSLLQPAIQEAPGVTGVSGAIPYNTSPIPPGGVKVSTDAGDYPPADAPPPPPPPLPTNMVGPKAMSSVTFTGANGVVGTLDVYIAGPGTTFSPSPNIANGRTVIQGGVTFTAVWEHGPFGLTVVYTCAPGSVQA